MGMMYEYDDDLASIQIPGGPPWQNSWGSQAIDRQRALELMRALSYRGEDMDLPKSATKGRERILKHDIDACLADFERQMGEGR